MGDVEVLPLVDLNLESKKCMHVVELKFVFDSQQTVECIIKEAQIQDLAPLDDFD